MKNNIRYSIYIILIIILTLICFYLLLTDNKKQYFKEYSTVNMESISKNKVYPLNFSKLHTKYKGKLKKDDIYEKFYVFINNTIPYIYENTNEISSEKELIEYFNTNEQYIVGNLGNISINNFIALANVLKENKIDKVEYQNSEIDLNSYDFMENCVQFKLVLNYSNDVKLSFNVKIPNNTGKTENIEFIPIIEE